MSQDAQFAHAHMVRFDRMLPGPIEKVWAVLTDTKWLPGWYGAGAIRGVVTQWDPPQRLAYSWNVYNPGDTVSPYPESYLTLTLAPSGNDVALTLEHLLVLERFVKLNAMGWQTYLDMVTAAAHGETVQSRDSYMAKNAKDYGIDLANPLA